MTALHERPAATDTVTDEDVSAYLNAARPYARTHPGNGTGAVRAGISAVLTNRDRHPQPVRVHTGARLAWTLAELAAACREGWEPIGSSTLANGPTVYWLKRTEPADQDGAP